MRTTHQLTAIKAILHIVLEQEAYKAYGTIGGASRVARLVSDALDNFSDMENAIVYEQNLERADNVWAETLKILERALKKGYEVEFDTINTISRM